MIPCCHLDGEAVCGEVAEFEIISVRSTAEGERMAGPDPYSDQTYSCEGHVGAMLGHQTDAVEQEHIFWKVLPLAPSEVGEPVRLEAA